MRLLSLTLLLALVVTPLLAQKQQKISDDILVDQVRVKLANDAEVGGQPIGVDVHDGVVTLTGKVKTDRQKSRAEKLTKKMKGVTSVENKLVVRPD